MPADAGTRGKAAVLLQAIREGRVTDREAAERACDLSGRAIPATLQRLADAGLIAYEKLHARAIDWSSLRAVDGGAPSPAPSKPARRRAKGSKMASKRPASKAKRRARAVDDGLSVARGVTIDDESIERFRAWSKDLRAQADAANQIATEVAAMVEALEELPRLGAEGALVFGLLRRLHADGEG